MPYLSPASADQAGHNVSAINNTSNNHQPPLMEVDSDELQTCSGKCCCNRSCGCTCKECCCSRSNPRTINSNRNIYGSQGGCDAANLTAGMANIGLGTASYSTDTSITPSNTFDERAAPLVTVLQARECLADLNRSHRHQDAARVRQSDTRRFVDDEHPWDANPWEQFLETEDTSDENIFDMDSLHVSVDLSDAERSVHSSLFSAGEQRSVTTSDLVSGTGGIFEGYGRLRPSSGFVVLCSDCRH